MSFSTDSILLALVQFGILFFVLMALGQLFRRQKEIVNWALAGLFFCLAIYEFANFNTDQNLVIRLPALALIDLPINYLTGPILFIIVKEALKKSAKESNLYWPHFILPAAALVTSLPFYFENDLAKAGRMQVLIQGSLEDVAFIEYFYFGGIVVLAGYTVYFFKNIASVLDPAIIRSERVVQYLVYMLSFALVTVLLIIAGIILQAFILFRVASAFMVLGGCLFYLLNARDPELLSNFTLALKQSKYKKSHLDNVDLVELKERLDHLMKEEKLFMSENITLSLLANRLDLNQNQLSQFLNQHMQKSFYEYITGFRIELAKEMLRNSDDPVLTIAYKVGFNSVSAFNTGFKRIAGTTAKAYRLSQA